MIYVVASIRVKQEHMSEFVEAFKANVPNVLAEDGCVEYSPVVDIDADLQPQALDENIMMVIEKWASLDALRAHLQAPHMMAYKEATGHMVEDVTLKVQQDA